VISVAKNIKKQKLATECTEDTEKHKINCEWTRIDTKGFRSRILRDSCQPWLANFFKPSKLCYYILSVFVIVVADPWSAILVQ